MDLMEFLRTKRTYRRFEQNRPISDEVLADMMEAARLSSSAGNQQPLRYLVVRSKKLNEQVFPFTYWAAALTDEIGRPKEGRHPVMYWAVLCEKDSKNGSIGVDAGLAMIREILQIDPSMEILYMIAFGYPAHESTVISPDASGKLAYHMDEQENFYVPKRELRELFEVR